MSNQAPKQGDEKFAKNQKEETQRDNYSRTAERPEVKKDKSRKEEGKKSDSRRSK
jgi:hypothetical protein